jgi:branched-subunit amino acid aminotransferase/4-amino-4-deoxychorismate lyase
MSATAISWIGAPGHTGQWDTPDTLAIPLDERGLLLADGLFETVLVEQGAPQLLAPHIQRWHHSAGLLALTPPPSLEQIEALVQEAMQRSGIRTGALRLNWSRGGGGRGIDLPADGGTPRFWLQLSAASPSFEPVAVIVSPTERRCATSVLSRCKTFAYGPSIQARRQARAAGADDALLESTAGGLCCGTTANLLLEIGGQWLTPPLSSGCLPGVMRQRALELGLVAEATEPIGLNAVAEGRVTAAWLINSLGCRPLRSLNHHPLHHCNAAEAEAFWRDLLVPSMPSKKPGSREAAGLKL